jgi:hypothetical protein
MPLSRSALLTKGMLTTSSGTGALLVSAKNILFSELRLRHKMTDWVQASKCLSGQAPAEKRR